MAVDPTDWDEFPLCAFCGSDAYYVDIDCNGAEEFTCHTCRWGNAVTRRRINVRDMPHPLTVAEAAERENMSTRTIYRWLNGGELGDGAWQVGSKWRIDPAALDRHRNQGPKPRKARTATSNPVVVKGKNATQAPVDDWPS